MMVQKGPKKDPPKIRRMLIAKVIGFKSARRKDWKPPRVDALLRTVIAASPTIAQRHVPDPANGTKGQQCAFINRAIDYGDGGMLIEVCTYLQGHVPESMIPDLTKPAADISPVEIKDEDGNSGELVHSFRCLILGQVMVLEGARGVGGASQIVQTLITNLIRRHTIDKTHPSLVLVDILASELKKMIESKGGVERITAKLAVGPADPDSKYAAVLSGTRNGVKNATACAVTWEAAGTLDTDESIAILQEAEDEALSSVVLHFKTGGSISDFNTYRERREVYIQQIADGRIAVTELEGEMRDYLDFLRKGGAIESITEDGTVTKIKTIGHKGK